VKGSWLLMNEVCNVQPTASERVQAGKGRNHTCDAHSRFDKALLCACSFVWRLEDRIPFLPLPKEINVTLEEQ